MTGILFPHSGVVMNMAIGETAAIQVCDKAGGKSPVVSKRKEREDGDASQSSTTSAPSSKRPKPSKSSSSDAKEPIITKTHIKLDLDKKTLTLIQDPQPLDKYTSYLSLMARFQEWLMDQPLSPEIPQIPREYWPLLAMIGHEYAVSQKARLVEFVGAALKPTDVGDGEVAKLSTSSITTACTALFTQQTYGFHPSDFPHLSPADKDLKISAYLALKRWEVKDLDIIPQSTGGRGFKARDVMIERRRVRELAREEVKQVAKELEGDVARGLLGLASGEKAAGKAGNGEVKAENGTTVLQAKPVKPKPEKVKPELTPEQLAEKETKEADKKAREAERLKRVEAKLKNEQEVAKSKAMMKSFFGRKVEASPVGQGVVATATATASGSGGGSRAQSRSESIEVECLSSDFQASFRPFYAKGTVEVALVNRFALRPDVVMPGDEDVAHWQPKDMLSNFLKHASRKTTHPLGRPTPRRTTIEQSRSGLVRKPKTEPLFCTIPDLVDRAQEAEDPRLVYSHLKDHAKFPRKVFKFDEDLRPPYQGTWTKPSWFVGPRTPFALDPNTDYAVDEGLDWEPENLDEGAMDVEEDEEPESEEDEDMGSWLASDDELDEEPSRSMMDDPFGGSDPLGMPVVKPKASKETKLPPRRFEKLVQFQKGPVWESGLGEVAWKGFEQYRICVLNDTPLGGIDPFTWQAPEFVKPIPASIKSTPAVVKSPTAVASVPTPQPTVSAPSPTPIITPKTLAPRPVPKAVFTVPQLADFLRTIEGSDKLKRALVVELSGRFPTVGTQMSIKAKLEEVASKSNAKGSVWVVKPAAWAEAGVVPSASKV